MALGRMKAARGDALLHIPATSTGGLDKTKAMTFLRWRGRGRCRTVGALSRFTTGYRVGDDAD